MVRKTPKKKYLVKSHKSHKKDGGCVEKNLSNLDTKNIFKKMLKETNKWKPMVKSSTKHTFFCSNKKSKQFPMNFLIGYSIKFSHQKQKKTIPQIKLKNQTNYVEQTDFDLS